jgi:hypothetical protein
MVVPILDVDSEPLGQKLHFLVRLCADGERIFTRIWIEEPAVVKAGKRDSMSCVSGVASSVASDEIAPRTRRLRYLCTFALFELAAPSLETCREMYHPVIKWSKRGDHAKKGLQYLCWFQAVSYLPMLSHPSHQSTVVLAKTVSLVSVAESATADPSHPKRSGYALTSFAGESTSSERNSQAGLCHTWGLVTEKIPTQTVQRKRIADGH